MASTPLPRIEPLIESIKKLSIGDFLKSVEFKRYLIKIELDLFWRQEYESVRINRKYVSTFTDHEKFDSIDTFVNVCNLYYTEYSNGLFDFLKSFLFYFYEWKKEEVNIIEVVKDLKLLGASDYIIKELNQKFNSINSKPVENTEIHKGIYNSI